MADFCNICTSQLFEQSKEEENEIGEILMGERLSNGGDINIEKIFEEKILPDIDDLMNHEHLGHTVGGICEHCGLIALSVKKYGDIPYLVAWCDKPSNEKGYVPYNIALIDCNNKLLYNEDELKKYYEEK